MLSEKNDFSLQLFLFIISFFRLSFPKLGLGFASMGTLHRLYFVPGTMPGTFCVLLLILNNLVGYTIFILFKFTETKAQRGKMSP